MTCVLTIVWFFHVILPNFKLAIIIAAWNYHIGVMQINWSLSRGVATALGLCRESLMFCNSCSNVLKLTLPTWSMDRPWCLQCLAPPMIETRSRASKGPGWAVPTQIYVVSTPKNVKKRGLLALHPIRGQECCDPGPWLGGQSVTCHQSQS